MSNQVPTLVPIFNPRDVDLNTRILVRFGTKVFLLK